MGRGHVEPSHAVAERERAPEQWGAVEECPVPAGHERLDVGAPGHQLDPEARQPLGESGAGDLIGGGRLAERKSKPWTNNPWVMRARWSCSCSPAWDRSV